MPTVCPIGFYRSVVQATRCLQCPKGTFSFERGIQDYLGCQECPPGRSCEEEGLRNVTQTAPCTDGQVCLSGTGARKQIPCPEGYYCPEQTSASTMYANQCEAGFFCRVGTGEASKTRDNCPQTYYCPPGSGVYDYQSNYLDYSNWRGDAPTRCPIGTGVDGSDTKTSILECGINVEYKLMIASLDIRSQYGENSLEDEGGGGGGGSSNSESRRLAPKKHLSRVNSKKVDQRTREKQGFETETPLNVTLSKQRDLRGVGDEESGGRRRFLQEVASKDDPRL